ncbi:MAG: toxin-antitoxin system YwqK family antitoxin [Ekhidna sp.]
MLKRTIYIVLFLTSFFSMGQIQQGKRYFDSDSSKIQEIYHFSLSDTALNGLYESFYLNGSLQTLGWYTNNQPDSSWIYYYENGRKKAEGNYQKGEAKGNWSYYFENGNIKSTGLLKDKTKQGVWTFYFENGGEKSSGKYDQNEKTGIWNYFFEGGAIKAQALLEDGSGNYVEFFPSGARRMEGQNTDGKSDGEWTYYFETGEKEAVGNFQKGLRTEKWNYYHKNGELAATGQYSNGLRTGDWKYYHENGKISQSGSIVNDRKDGYWKLFYPTGELQGEVAYEKGNGDFKEYHPNGSQKSKGEIVDGVKTGKWYYYSENGDIEGEADLINGKGEYTGYYANGTVKMKGHIENDKRIGEWTLFNSDGSLAGTYTPIYEDEKPIFKIRESVDIVEKEQFEKPEYKFKRRGWTYFQPRINEYRAAIIGTNPIWLLDKQIPIAIEYYMQERLGYELQIDIIRNPFFIPDSEVTPNTVYERGVKVHFRQKFYHQDQKLGMPYFGHQVSFGYTNHQLERIDPDIAQDVRFGNLAEQSFGYGIFVGNRWMKDPGNKGLTLDTFIGIGISKRSYNREDNFRSLDSFFDPVIKSSVFFPLLLGINIGFAGPKSKSKTL